MLDNITKFPVFVIASPRTGSTAVLRYISEKYDMAWYNEIHSEHNKDLAAYNLISDPANLDWYVCKFFAMDYEEYYSWIGLKSDYNIIRLRRRNVMEQILSHYAATVTDKFIYYNPIEEDIIELPVDKEQIAISAAAIVGHNYYLDNLKLRPDIDLYYEDLGVLKNNKTFVGPEITNKEALLEQIQKEYEKCHKRF